MPDIDVAPPRRRADADVVLCKTWPPDRAVTPTVERCPLAQTLLGEPSMRTLAILSILTACTEHGSTPGGGPTQPELPAACVGHCIVEDPDTDPTSDLCCDSVTCFLDDETNEWIVTFCDPPLDPCFACTIDQICVQSLDGTCGLTTACVDRVVDCPDNTCSVECEAAYCGSPFQCQNRAPCGIESTTAFTCYGP